MEAPIGYDRTFERIAFINGVFKQVAVVDVTASVEDGKVYAWRMDGDAPLLVGGPFDSVWDGFQWARQLRYVVPAMGDDFHRTPSTRVPTAKGVH